MHTFLRHSYQIAKKEYNCDGCREILSIGVNGNGLTISELRTIVKAKRQKYKILPGQRYLKQVSVDNGILYVWRCIPEIYDIMTNHMDLFFEDW